MNAKILWLSILAEILAMILTIPLLFYAALTAWGDECGSNAYTPCSSETFWSGALFFGAFGLVSIVIGWLLMKKFAHYSQNILLALVVFGVSISIQAVITGKDNMGITVLLFIIYPVYSLVESAIRANSQRK